MVHQLKGSAANFGAARFCALCEQLEIAAGEETLDTARHLLKETRLEFGRVRAALEKEFVVCPT